MDNFLCHQHLSPAIVAKSWFGATAPLSADPDGGNVSKHASQSQVHDKIVGNLEDLQTQAKGKPKEEK